VIPEPRVPKEIRDTRAFKGVRVPRETRVIPENKDLRVSKAIRASKE